MKVGDRKPRPARPSRISGAETSSPRRRPIRQPCSAVHARARAAGRTHAACRVSSEPSSGSRVAPFHQGRGDQPDHERDRGADRGHDQDRRYRAGNLVSLEKAGSRRQHGTDHECRYHREKEPLGGVEDGNHANDQESDQGKGNDLRAADHRRQFGSAVRQRRAGGFMRRRTLIGKDTQLALPRAAANLIRCPPRATNRILPPITRGVRQRFHRADVTAGAG